MSDYTPRRLCRATQEAALDDGTVIELRCSDTLGHAEDHSCRVWWTNEDPGSPSPETDP